MSDMSIVRAKASSDFICRRGHPDVSDVIDNLVARIKELEEQVGREQSYCGEWQRQCREMQARIEELETERDVYKATCMADDALIAQQTDRD